MGNRDAKTQTGTQFPIQFPANTFWSKQMMTQVLGSALPTGEAQINFMGPGHGLAHPCCCEHWRSKLARDHLCPRLLYVYASEINSSDENKHLK